MNAERRAGLLRMRGFLRKEVLQILRDPSSILLAVVMPVVLLFLFGFGLSLNPQRIPIAVVDLDRTGSSRELIARFRGTDSFALEFADSFEEAEALLGARRVDGVLGMHDGFEAALLGADRAPAQIILNGVDANRAALIRGYVSAALESWSAVRRARGEEAPSPPIRVEARTWFNASLESRNNLVPGLNALIMTLVGTLLTALVIAREWERGTMEAILATPLRAGEFLLGKILPYFALGLAGLAFSVTFGILLFDVPFRGSVWLLALCGSLFLLAALGLGLAFSAVFRVQFIAAQVSVIAGFLPAFFLSGLLFDLHSTPLPIQVVSHVIPARYFVRISHTLFLAGDIGAILWPSSLALAFAAALFLTIARRHVGERLE